MTIEHKDSKRIVKLSTDAVETVIEDDFTSDNWVTEESSVLNIDTTNNYLNFIIKIQN